MWKISKSTVLFELGMIIYYVVSQMESGDVST